MSKKRKINRVQEWLEKDGPLLDYELKNKLKRSGYGYLETGKMYYTRTRDFLGIKRTTFVGPNKSSGMVKDIETNTRIRIYYLIGQELLAYNKIIKYFGEPNTQRKKEMQISLGLWEKIRYRSTHQR